MALFGLLHPRGVAAQSCPVGSNVVSVTVTVADGSTPTQGPTVCPNPQNWPQGCYSGSWGSPIEVSITYAGTYTLRAYSGGYLEATGGSASCTNVDGCLQCGGGGSFSLFASSGAIAGTVYDPTSGGVATSGWVFRSTIVPPIPAAIDQNGRYEFRSTMEPARSNNWGLTVYGDGSGPGVGTYELTVSEWENRVQATTMSSFLAEVPLFLNAPEQPEKRMCPYPPGPDGVRPCDSRGRPVNLATGNVWFDQTDISMPGAGAALRLDRSYNSDNAFRAIAGSFGRGWTHSYEATVSVTGVVLKLREGDGTVLFFEDRDGDSTFQPSLPLTERSWVVQAGSTFTRQFRAGGSETYDSAGRLTSIVSPAGQATSVVRDGTGRITGIAVPGGRSVAFEYDGSGKVSGLYGPDGVIASYEYDPAGMLQIVRYPDGTGYVFTYGGSGEVLTVADLTGSVIEMHAYAGGKGITSEIANGVEKLTFTYNGPQTVVTDALGNATTYDFVRIRAMRYIAKITGPCPSCGGAGSEPQEWTYDNAGRVMSYKDAAGTVTSYTYDGSGDLVGETSPAGTITYTYDAQGRVLTRTAPATGTVTYVHGPAGPTSVTEQVTATESRTTTIQYNAAAQPDTITDPRNKTTTLAYNASGDLTSVTDPLNNATSFGYDAMGRRTTVTTALNHTTTTAYDERGRVTRITAPDNTYTEFAYDGSGQRKSVIDPSGRVTSYLYDAYGRLESVVDPLDGVTRYGYDVMSNLTSLTDAEGRVTGFEYDAFARVKKVIYPGGANETFTYDAAGRLATRTDRKTIITTYSYDNLSRLTGKTYSDGTTAAVSFTYDAAGRLLTAANGTDTLTWTYGLAGQVLTEASSKNASTVAYTYDLAGSRLTVGLDGQVFVTYGYDDASRLTSITRASSVFALGYDNANRRTTLTYPNGVSTAYTYDSLSRLTNLAATLSSTTITQWGYTYDPSGNRTQKASPEYTEDYGYDSLSRLTEVNRTGAAGAKRWIHGYDRVGNRTREQIDNNVSTPTYNERNQLLSSTVGGMLRFRGTLDEPGTVTVSGQPARMLAGNTFEATVTATPGANTVPVVATDASGNTRTTNYQVTVSGTTASYTYDPNGNLIQKTDGNDTWTYEWDAEDRLKRVLKNAVEVARFGYDPLGRRVEKVAGGTTTTWTYDGEDIVRQTAGGTTLKYVHGPGIDEPLGQEDGTGVLTFLHADDLGSIVKTTNSTGSVTTARQYDAFGNPEIGATNGYGFTGREWDAETGLAYFRARYYDPKAGRFIAEDPIQWNGGINLYGHVGNDPVGWIDPYGMRRRKKPKSRAQEIETMAEIMQLMLLTPESRTREYGFRICERPSGDQTYGPGAVSETSDRVTVPDCPAGTKPVATCHTHPTLPGAGYPGVHPFGDRQNAAQDYRRGVLYFVGAIDPVTGLPTIWQYDPAYPDGKKCPCNAGK